LPLTLPRTPLRPAVVALAVVALLAPGCATIKRPAVTQEALAAGAGTARIEHRHLVDGLVEALVRRAERRGDHTLDVLYLSGGGQHGAYGVGFMRGWKGRSDAPMPAFDLVTGVSTGALQSPLALLGTDAALDTLDMMYGRTALDGAPTIDATFWIRRTGGVLDVTKFRSMIERTTNRDLIENLAPLFAEDRRLVVATTDLDLGMGRLWDVYHELAASPAGLTRFRDLLQASSAIPGAFPPVLLDGRVHADGGNMSNLAMALDEPALRDLAARLRARGLATAAAPVTLRLWAIVNVWTHPAPHAIKPSSPKEVESRGRWLMFYGQQIQGIAHLAQLARAVTATEPGLAIEFHATSVPADLAGEPGAQALIDENWMERLKKVGEARARGGRPWDDPADPYERPLPVETGEK